MIPFLTYPLALIALASVPALAAIYILRNRYRRRTVSSLVLWRFHIQAKPGGATIHRLQLPLLFFLELLALVLLVAAAAGPHWQLPQSNRPLIVILDDSFSMRAAAAGVSAQARAGDYLKQLFQHQPPPYVRLILAGTEPRLLGGSVRTWPEVEQLLAQWHCWSPGAAIDAAITLAAELGKQQANLLVLTDHKPADETITNRRLEWQALGAPLDNLAIVNASRTVFGDQDRCLLEIANFSGAARTAQLLVQTGSNGVQQTSLTLGARDRQRLVFNVPAGAPSLRATLEADALAEDNEVQLLPALRHKVRVQVTMTNSILNSLASRALDATGLRAAISENPELVIHESAVAAGSNAWNLQWLSATGATAYIGPFIVDDSHPLAAGIALEGVVWAAAAPTNPSGDVPVILAGNTALLSGREDVLGRRQLTLNFNPELSTLQNTPAWPVLFWNLLQWRAAESPGLREANTHLGTEVILKTTGEPVSVTLPDGTARSFPKTGGDLALETPQPGLYSIAMGPATSHLAVNPLAADESDLSGCARGHWGAWGDIVERRRAETSIVWMFGLAALGILIAHLYLMAAGKGGR